MARFFGFALVAIVGLYFVLWVGLYSADFGKSPARLAMDRRISDRGTCARQARMQPDKPEIFVYMKQSTERYAAYVQCMVELGYQSPIPEP